MKCMLVYVDLVQLLVGHFDGFFVGLRVEFTTYSEACPGGGGRYQFHDGKTALQRFTAPILGYVAKQPMLDLVDVG
jgi:hypothetical protein